MGGKAAIRASKSPVYIYLSVSLAVVFFAAAIVLVSFFAVNSPDYTLYVESFSDSILIENPLDIILRDQETVILDEAPPLSLGLEDGGLHRVAGCAAIMVIFVCGVPTFANWAAYLRVSHTRDR